MATRLAARAKGLSEAEFRKALGTLIWLAVAWLLSTSVAQAQNIAEKDAQQAQETCRELLRTSGFRNIEVGVMKGRDDGERVEIEVEAERMGDERRISCVYDRQSGAAELRE